LFGDDESTEDDEEEEAEGADKLVESGKTARSFLRREQKTQMEIDAVNANEEGKRPMKRPRDDSDEDANSARANATGGTGRPDSPDSTEPTSTLALTSEQVKAFVYRQPGHQVSFKVLGAAFKKAIKAENKKKGPASVIKKRKNGDEMKGSDKGSKLFLSIVAKHLKKVDDPALGPVYKVK
jgi:hypothetical protein